MKINTNIIYVLGYIITVCINFISVYKMLGIAAAFISAAIIFLCFIGALKSKKTFKNCKRLTEVLLIIFILFLFIQSAILSPITNITHTLRAAVCATFISVIFLSLFIIVFADITSIIKRIKKSVKTNKFFVIILAVSVLLRIIQFHTMPIFDAEAYYSALAEGCINFDFSISDFLHSFMLYKHPTLGYAALLAIGEFISPGNFVGINIINLLITLAVIICIYCWLKCCFKHLSNVTIGIAVLFISCLPMFLGTFSYIHMDYGIAIFFILAIYMYHRQNYILGVCCSLLLLSSKEVGVVLYAGYFAGLVLYEFFHVSGNFVRKFSVTIRKKELWITFTPIIAAIFWIVLVLSGVLTFWNPVGHNTTSSSLSVVANPDSHALNVIGWNSDYVIYKLQQIFVFDGHWVLSLMLIAGIIVFIFSEKKQRKYSYETKREIIATSVGFLFMMLFSLFYITYSLMRYNIVLELFIGIAAVFSVLNILSKDYLKQAIIGSATIFLTTQAFVSIDPITNSMTETLDTGKVKINFLSNNTTWPGDPLVYNYHYNYINKVIDSILRKYDYNGENIYIIGQQKTLWPQGRYNVYVWDKENERRVYNGYANEKSVWFSTLYANTFSEIPTDAYSQKAILIFLPIYNVDTEVTLQEISKVYQISAPIDISIPLLGDATYYELNLKTRE